jgi:hypothetical protein
MFFYLLNSNNKKRNVVGESWCLTGFAVLESLDLVHNYCFRFQFFMRQAVHAFMSHNRSHCEFRAKETFSNFQFLNVQLKCHPYSLYLPQVCR